MEMQTISGETARKLASEGKIQEIGVEGSWVNGVHITHMTASGGRQVWVAEQTFEEALSLKETSKMAGNIVDINYKNTPQNCTEAMWKDITAGIDPKEIAAIELRRSGSGDTGDTGTEAKTKGTYRIEAHMLDAKGRSMGQVPSPQLEGLACGSMNIGQREIPFAKHESILDFGNEEFKIDLVSRGGQSSADHIEIAPNKNGTFTPQVTHGVNDHPSGVHTRSLFREPETKVPIEFGTQSEAHTAAWQFTMADRERRDPALKLRDTKKQIHMKENLQGSERARPEPDNMFASRLQPTTDVLKNANLERQESKRGECGQTEHGTTTETSPSEANPRPNVEKEKSEIRKMTMLVIAGTGLAIASAVTGGTGWAIAAVAGFMAIHGARKVSEKVQEMRTIQATHAAQTRTARMNKQTGKERQTP